MTAKIYMLLCAVLVLLTGCGKPEGLPDPGNLVSYRGQNDTVLYFEVTGKTTGGVWGDGIYSDDSELATAAVHAGVLADGETGVVKVTILPGQEEYGSSENNGVTSWSYGEWSGSYKVEKI